MFPAHRELLIAAPVLAAAEAKIKITILASTDARGERVGADRVARSAVLTRVELVA